MFNRVENLENNVQGIIFSSILRIEVETFESNFWTPISPYERKAISECFGHPAVLSRSKAWRGCQNLL